MGAPIRSLGLWWLRRDLRTADNEALAGACRQVDALLPVFCFDPRDVQPRRGVAEGGLGVPKLGPHRCRFLLEGLWDLRREVQRLQPPGGEGAAVAAAATATVTATATDAAGMGAGAGAGTARWQQQQQQTALSQQPTSEPTAAQAGGGGGGGPGAGGLHAVTPSRGDSELDAAAGADGGGGSGSSSGSSSSSSGGGSSGGGSSGGGSSGGASSGGGSSGAGGLVVRFGRAEEVLPRLLTLVVAHNPQLRHVSLHHHLDLDLDLDPLGGSAELERAVQAGLRSWAERQGVSLSVHTYWDRTLYHPDDLPYHLYDKAAPQRGAAAASRGRPLPPALSFPLPPNADPDRFRSIPPVMTNFRKATQSAASVRPSLPAPTALPPLPAPFGGDGRDAGAGAAAAAAAAAAATGVPEPAAECAEAAAALAAATAAAAAADGGGLGEIPQTMGEVYDAAPGGRTALRRLEELVGLDYSSLLPPVDPDGGGPHAAPTDPRTAFPFHAGQYSAVRRLRYYVWGHQEGPRPAAAADPRVGDGPTGRSEVQQRPGDAPAVVSASPPSLLYFTNTRAQAVGVDSSTKLSPFVALGCITPRQIHEEVERVREAAAAAGAGAAVGAAAAGTAPRGAGSAAAGGGSGGAGGGGADAPCAVPPPAECDWLAMHLCIRDFFIYTVLKEGNAVLDERGIVGRPVSWRQDREAFARWARGCTGLPFVDANMRELAASGWMSNRGRQNVASLLTKDLGLDWRWGAELFESLLLDCDVAVNYCNWNYFAGIGNDPRNRHFKTVTQGIQYDEDAVLAATWLPELARLPPPLRHQPWTMTEAEAQQYGVVLGRDYPAPMLDPAGHIGTLTGTGKRKTKSKAKAQP